MSQTVIQYDKPLPDIEGRDPYTAPIQHLRKLGAGRYEIAEGRRPSSMLLVNKLREAVNEWRGQEYPGISEVSRRLMTFWFEEDHILSDGSVFRYYYAQREALETLIYLIEAQGYSDLERILAEFGDDAPTGHMFQEPFKIETTVDGNRLVRRWIAELQRESVQELPQPDLLRFAVKMATGSGKTHVMAMAIVWSYYHRLRIPGSRLADNFLIVAPNIIVFERLEKDFASNRIFYELPLVPPEWKSQWNMKIILRGESTMPDPSGNLVLVNIQQIYEGREDSWEPTNAVDAILGRAPKKDLASHEPSMLERIKSLRNLMVLNDEAHHVHDDELVWNQTLLAIHSNLKTTNGHGLTAWLDFSATPKDQSGAYFPWIVVDYPLAQAIEDRVVKAPLIVHQVNKTDPDKVTQNNVVDAYHDWILAALQRWDEHVQVFGGIGQKPVLFIMAERTAYANAIGEHIRTFGNFRRNEILIIHTDTTGEIQKGTLDEAREAARDIDTNQIKVIVSVLMLREGWDVRNVTIILGLRPFTSQANILPEQAVGRGLRLMRNISPDRHQTLEVMGTAAFEDFVRQLETEGVGIDTVTKPPKLPVKIYPVQEKSQYDIAIPLTKPKYSHQYTELAGFDPLTLAPISDAEALDERLAVEIRMDFATTGTEVHRAVIGLDRPLMSSEFLNYMTTQVMDNLRLSGRFAEVYPIVKTYVQDRCFGQSIDLEADKVKTRLRDPRIQGAIVGYLTQQIGHLSAVERAIEFQDAKWSLSLTPPFTWRREHVECTKTIFNLCATFNNFETRFVQFLDSAPDVLRFAALAETFTKFRVDYLSTRGAIKFYYPDFVAVQETGEGDTSWIIETKGRAFEGVEQKNRSIMDWCQKITDQTGRRWRFLFVPQSKFDDRSLSSLEELIRHLQGTDAGAPLFDRQ